MQPIEQPNTSSTPKEETPEECAKIEDNKDENKSHTRTQDETQAQTQNKVPSKFKPYPFPYHHTFTSVVQSITNLGMGVCRIDIPETTDMPVGEGEVKKRRRRRGKGNEGIEIDKTEGLDKGGGEFERN